MCDRCLTSQILGSGDWVQLYGQLFNQPCLHNETSNKIYGHQSLRDLSGWWMHWCGRSLMHPDLVGKEHGNSAFRTLPEPALCVSTFGWSWFRFLKIKFNGKYSSFLSSGSYSSKLLNLREEVWECPRFVTSCSDVQVAWGPPNFQLASEGRVGSCP